MTTTATQLDPLDWRTVKTAVEQHLPTMSRYHGARRLLADALGVHPETLDIPLTGE
jgi:hypothetical protein